MKLRYILIASTMVVGSSAAYAGTLIYGYGESKSAAMAQADSRAEAEARRRGTCISEYARPNTCKIENDMWSCYAIVANHKGSC